MDGGYGAGAGVCHTTTYVQAMGTSGDRQLQEAQAPGEATACCSGDRRGNLAHAQPPVRVWSGNRCHLMSRRSEQGRLAACTPAQPRPSQVALEPGSPSWATGSSRQGPHKQRRYSLSIKYSHKTICEVAIWTCSPPPLTQDSSSHGQTRTPAPHLTHEGPRCGN